MLTVWVSINQHFLLAKPAFSMCYLLHCLFPFLISIFLFPSFFYDLIKFSDYFSITLMSTVFLAYRYYRCSVQQKYLHVCHIALRYILTVSLDISYAHTLDMSDAQLHSVYFLTKQCPSYNLNICSRCNNHQLQPLSITTTLFTYC